MADGRKRPWKPSKRRSALSGSGGSGGDVADEGIELVDLRAAHVELVEERRLLMQPLQSEGLYNMHEPDEKARLARDLWKGDFSASMLLLRDQNPQLVEVLRAKLANSSDATSSRVAAVERYIDGVLLDICRAQNMFKIPLLTAATSLMCEVNKTAREYHDTISAFHLGAACSERWVNDFLPLANACRPAPTETMLPGVMACCFDNLSMKIDYGSYSTEGETGRLLDMTNWFSTQLPAHLAPNFDAAAICARRAAPRIPDLLLMTCACVPAVRDGPFARLSLRDFGSLFYSDYPEIVANKTARWIRFLNSERNGRLLDRPAYVAEWQPHKVYHEPMYGVLQSSYQDVELELRVMCGRPAVCGTPPAPYTDHDPDYPSKFRSCKIMFVAGDGLALMRLNHLLANKPDVYIDQTPLIIPIQGEHPHGLFHVMHCEWRLHRQFIMWCAGEVNNQQVIEDPNVSVFNEHRFFYLHVLTRACAQYIIFISKTAGAETLDEPIAFLAKSEANIDFAWVCHFLYDAGFFVLDFLQSVRANRSHTLDLLWREFFASAHSGTANKTQYVPMSIMRVFWGMALTPELSKLYHRIRTLPGGLGAVGWDMAVEMLNAAIKAHVAHRVSEAQINAFIRSWALLECVQKKMREFIYPGRSARQVPNLADANRDVARLVERFKAVIGTTWFQAVRPNQTSHVTTGAQRLMVPWREVAAVMNRTGAEAPATYVRNHVTPLTPFFTWDP